MTDNGPAGREDVRTCLAGLAQEKDTPLAARRSLADERCTAQAERDQLTTARTAWLKSRELRMAEGMDEIDWYLQGRLAERAGLSKDAARAYHRIKRPKSRRANSIHALARRTRPAR